jgi:hypothetical protein
VSTPLPRPNLKPRLGLFIAALVAFAIWVSFLAWVWVSQVVMKH